jgi:plastocyanin
MKRKLVICSIILTLVALALTNCANPASSPTPAPSPTPTSSGEANVSISGFAFNPAIIRVAVGTTVKWTNNDSAPHTVTSDSNLFESGTLSSGATFSYTLKQSGTYDYHCKIHASMRGTIIVE